MRLPTDIPLVVSARNRLRANLPVEHLQGEFSNMLHQTPSRGSVFAITSAACASISALLLIGSAAFAGGMSGVQTGSYALPADSNGAPHGLPISVLQQIVIDKGLPVDTTPNSHLPGWFGDFGNIDVIKPISKAPPPSPIVDSFDPAIYSVYGVLISDAGAQAIVGLVGGETQIVRCGDMIGDSMAMVAEITPDGIGVKVGKSAQIERIGFYGGDRVAPNIPKTMPSAIDVKPLPPL